MKAKVNHSLQVVAYLNKLKPNRNLVYDVYVKHPSWEGIFKYDLCICFFWPALAKRHIARPVRVVSM